LVIIKEESKKSKKGIYDKRNKINDLTGKEWLKLTKSVWISKRCAADKDAFEHPAPFLIEDIRKLVQFFTNLTTWLLIFYGKRTAIIAACLEDRFGLGIDL
jgi:hypothetical protein